MDTLSELQSYCHRNFIPHLVILVDRQYKERNQLKVGGAGRRDWWEGLVGRVGRRGWWAGLVGGRAGGPRRTCSVMYVLNRSVDC